MNQRQIATALGVSQTTVSLVLNNPKTGKISRDKRDLVLTFLQKTNYSSQPSNGKTNNIGYLLSSNITSEPHKRTGAQLYLDRAELAGRYIMSLQVMDHRQERFGNSSETTHIINFSTSDL
jgi:DNA-binding LacI/PurR family transcriptional regulator